MPSLFTQIMRRELPGEIVYETERETAFLDLYPASEGHTLVVPRLEVARFDELPPDDLASLMRTVQLVAKGVTRAMGTPHYTLRLNNGAPSGQIVFHVHFHVIPRWDGVPMDKRKLPPEKMREIGERIRAAIADVQAGR
jgi:histidine triad (HIT) family protein